MSNAKVLVNIACQSSSSTSRAVNKVNTKVSICAFIDLGMREMGLSKSQCKAVQELLLHRRSPTLKLWFTFCNEIEYSAENDSYFLSDQFVVVGNMYLISSPFIHWLLVVMLQRPQDY